MMSITDKAIACIVFITGLVIFCLFLPVRSYGQTTIKAKMVLTPDSVRRTAATSTAISTAAANIPVQYVAPHNGKFKIIFEEGQRKSNPFNKKTSLTITVTDSTGKKRYERKYFPGDYFPSYITGDMSPDCPDTWYLYGKGPFEWNSGVTGKAIDDAWVFSLSCSSEYGQSTNHCQTTNFGNSPYENATAWTWWGAPAVIRSYLRFNGLHFTGPARLDTAVLSLYESGRSWALSGSNAFTVSTVAGSWDENTLNWQNRPGAGSPSIPGPAGTGDVRLNVTSIVSRWLANPGSNYGFHLALQNEQHYRNRSFYSSEGHIPPHLMAKVSNPTAAIDTLIVTDVKKRDKITLDYAANGNVYSSDTELSKEINGKQVSGQQFIFNVTGPTCTKGGVSEHVQAFGWVDSSPFVMIIPGKKEIWPTIPSFGAFRTFFKHTKILNTKKGIQIRVMRDGQPAADQSVHIYADWVVGSGGHSHNGYQQHGKKADKIPPKNSKGVFIDQATNYSSKDFIVAVTNSDGLITVNYTAPHYGGKVVLRATTQINGQNFVARDTLQVRVPNLVLLPKGINYRKVGGTANHPGPRLDGLYPNSRTPDTDHWITETFKDSLIAIANVWHNLVLEDSTQDDRQTPLNINDISLIDGGQFDVLGNWNQPHQFHRVGRDADIRTTRSFPMNPSSRNGVILHRMIIAGKVQLINKEFQNICFKKGGYPTPEVHSKNTSNEHYHIYFYRY